MGGGSILGSLVPRRKAPSIRRTATALGVLGVSRMVFALSPWMWLSIAAAFAAGTGGWCPGRRLRQSCGSWLASSAPADHGIVDSGMVRSKPIASLIDGTLPNLAGLRITGVLMAVPC